MRIGILPYVDPSAGGIYQYSLTMLRALDQSESDKVADQFVLFTDELASPAVADLTNNQHWTLQPLRRPTLGSRTLNTVRRLVGEGPHRRVWRRLRSDMTRTSAAQPPVSPDPDRVQHRPETNQWFRDCGVDLMVYPAPLPLSFEVGVPYVMAIHDLMHRVHPEFPEVSAGGEWERREHRYRNGTRCGTLLLADSEVGKEDILNFYGSYGVTEDRVKVLPFLPASYLTAQVSERERQRVRAIYKLPERYLFYPAQFWPHKNHRRIVQALGLLKKDRGLEIPMVFLGSHTGEIREQSFREVMSVAVESGLDEDLHYLGYVPDEDMSALYAEAAALVMPTFFGPTNIPVLEAWAFGCPVLTSDIRGVRDQVEDAGLLVDPSSVEALADGMHRIWTDESLARVLRDRGSRRLSQYTPADYRSRLMSILEEARARISSERAESMSA